MEFCEASSLRGAPRNAAICGDQLVGSAERSSRGRAVAASPTEADTRVRIFGRNFPSGGCGGITNYAALPHEQTAQGSAGRIARWICARRHHPCDERRNQRQPKSLGRADRRSPRHARVTVPVSAVRVGTMREAKRPVERVNLLKLTKLSKCRPEPRKVSMRMIWSRYKDWAKTERATISVSMAGIRPRQRRRGEEIRVEPT